MRKKKEHTYNYGECELCDTHLEERYVKQDFWIGGELIVIDHVCAGVCPKCGEKVVNADTGRNIAELLKHTEYISSAPRISVPVIMFDEFTELYVSKDRVITI
jgi:YgiT-type zinc finger domain-containing protein